MAGYTACYSSEDSRIGVPAAVSSVHISCNGVYCCDNKKHSHTHVLTVNNSYLNDDDEDNDDHKISDHDIHTCIVKTFQK